MIFISDQSYKPWMATAYLCWCAVIMPHRDFFDYGAL